MPCKVFISYSWSNSAERRALEAEIGAVRGAQVLVDRNFIRPGDPIHSKISGAIDTADCIVVLLTEEGLASTEVRDEISRAHDRGRLIVPVVAEGVSLERLPWYLRDVSWISYNPRDFDSVASKIAERIKQIADPLSAMDLEHVPENIRHQLESGAAFIEVPFSAPGLQGTKPDFILCELRLRNSEAVYVFKAHPLQEVGDVAEFLAHRLVPTLFYEDYEWLLVREGKTLRAFLTLEASSVKSGDSVLLLGNHKRPEWAPRASR